MLKPTKKGEEDDMDKKAMMQLARLLNRERSQEQ